MIAISHDKEYSHRKSTFSKNFTQKNAQEPVVKKCVKRKKKKEKNKLTGYDRKKVNKLCQYSLPISG